MTSLLRAKISLNAAAWGIALILFATMAATALSSAKPEHRDHSQSKQLKPEFKKLFGELAGVPKSLEPLDAEQCFDAQYRAPDVKQLLTAVYHRDFPISGVSLLLGIDNKSIAFANREFRYYFSGSESNAELDKELFQHIFNFGNAMTSLLDFKPRYFKLNNSNISEIKSSSDFPLLYIQSVGSTLEDVTDFRPYDMRYWSKQDVDASDKRKKIKEYLLDKFSSAIGKFNGSYMLIMAHVDTLIRPRYNVKEDMQTALTRDNLYGYFMSKQGNDGELTKPIVFKRSFSAYLTQHYLALIKSENADSFKTNIRTNLIAHKRGDTGNTYVSPTAFDKSLFLSIYLRIKPINMSKRVFIDSVLEVMAPCFLNSASTKPLQGS